MKNFSNQKSCCPKSDSRREGKGVLAGILYGLAPHTFCIAFIIFTVLGVTTATALLKPLLLNPYFFYILIAISFVFATIAAVFYFKQQGFITFSKRGGGLEISFLPSGIKRKWKYLLTLYGTTISINLLLFMIIFPITANISSGTSLQASISSAFGRGEKAELSNLEKLTTLQVDIPCPGHAPLIIGELKKINGVEDVKFTFPNRFAVVYNPEKTGEAQIISLDVFNTYKATIMGKNDNQITEIIKNPVQPQSQSNTGSGCGGGVGGRLWLRLRKIKYNKFYEKYQNFSRIFLFNIFNCCCIYKRIWLF